MKTSLSEGEIKARFHKMRRVSEARHQKEFVEKHGPNAAVKRIESLPQYKEAVAKRRKARAKRDRKTDDLSAHHPYIFVCRNCDANLSSPCPVNPRQGVKLYFPERVVDEEIVPCASCGSDPRFNTRASDGINISPDWDGVFSWEFPIDDPRFIPGRGVPMDRARAREMAKEYNMVID